MTQVAAEAAHPAGALMRSEPLLLLLLAWMRLHQREHLDLRWQAGFWKSRHQLARDREEALKAEVKRLKARIRELEDQRYGQKSERRRLDEHQPGGRLRRRRGHQKGRPGHGRLDWSDLPAREEAADLPAEAKLCPCCGLPLEALPICEESEVAEVEVRAYRRVIRRRCYRPCCRCGAVPGIVTAAAVPRLIPKGRLGVSVWVRILLDKFLYLRPTHRLLQELADCGLRLAAGTVAGGLQKLLPVFEPLYEAIRKHNLVEGQWNGDETSWRVFVLAEGKHPSHWFLWVFCSKSTVFYIIAPSRATRVAQDHFGKCFGWLVCDRYSVYKKLAKDGRIWLAHCWAHVRRDFLEAAAGDPDLQQWSADWVQRIGEVFRRNRERLPLLKRPRREGFSEKSRLLREALQTVRETARQQLQDPCLAAPCRKALQSLLNHWKELTLFVKRPQIPMDNNAAERALRGPVVGRKNFYGSGCEKSALLAAMLFTALQTVLRCGLNPQSWLAEYLNACAGQGGNPPPDLGPFLPWRMDGQQRARLQKPPRASPFPL